MIVDMAPLLSRPTGSIGDDPSGLSRRVPPLHDLLRRRRPQPPAARPGPATPPALLPPDRIQSGDQLSARLAVQQARDRQAISPLKGAQRRLGLGRQDAVDRA